jgi:aryl-alcohol dehydrogenase-like predicted oxidoreductase
MTGRPHKLLPEIERIQPCSFLQCKYHKGLGSTDYRMTATNEVEAPTRVIITDDLAKTATLQGWSILLCRNHRALVEAFEQSPEGFAILRQSRKAQEVTDQAEQIKDAVEKASQSAGRRYELCVESSAKLSILRTEDNEAVIQPQDCFDDESTRSGGLIITSSPNINATPHLRTMVQGRHNLLDVVEVALRYDHAEWDKARDASSLAANQATELILQGKDVLLAPSQDLDDDAKHQSYHHEAVIRAVFDVLGMINVVPRYLIVDGNELATIIANQGLRMRRAIVRGQTLRQTPVWLCGEQTSKWPGTPFMPYCSPPHAEFAMLEIVKAWELAKSPPRPPVSMQYHRLGKSALKVSRIILGCMSFGDPKWEGSPWILPETEALQLLKKAYDLGINTWDTADTYSNGQSEVIIGKALKQYNIPRSKVVILSKLYYPVMDDSSRPVATNDGPLVNQMGLSRKHIFDAVEGSLRRLNTSYIDVLQLHRLDRDAEPEEIMGALHDLVKMGKIHYIAGSSMYAWEFARLHYTAKMRGWTPFTSMQNFYNLLYREEEREMNAFCNAEGIGLTPWSPLARGLLGRPFHEKTARSEKDVKTKKWFENDAQNQAIIDRVEQLAKRKGCTMAALSTAWLLKKGCAPIVGINSEKRLEQTLEVFEVERGLTDADSRWLEEPYRALSVQAM